MKNVLFIVYSWPPSGGPGVQRCLKFCKYLNQFGWNPVVLTVENPETSAHDESLLAEIPSTTTVVKTKSLEPFKLYKRFTGKSRNEKLKTGHLKSLGRSNWKERLASWIRLNLFIPDAKIGWLPCAITPGKKTIRAKNIDLIFSSGPPHTVHLIARSLARSEGLPWVADFRDPWMDINYYHFNKRSSLTRYIDGALEKRCIRDADAITTVSQSLVTLLQTKATSTPSFLLPNGYDYDDFPANPKPHRQELVIYYGGSLTPDQVPEALLAAISKIKAKLGAPAIRLQLAGYACLNFEKAIARHGLEDCYEYLGYLPHNEAVKALIQADLSLLIVNNVPGNYGIVTGKIFEYLGASNPILGIGPPACDAAQILQKTSAGEIFDYDDVGGVTDFLERAIRDKEAFRSNFGFHCESYSRLNITRELVKIFDRFSM